MSAFSGSIQLDADSELSASAPILIPDQPGLAAGRLWQRPGAVLTHRQRTVTPEDRFEAQPTSAWDGQGALVFDGRLDDRIGLCEQLGIPHKQSLPDSVLVASAFEKWGHEAPTHLLGEYALAIFNSKERSLLLATDPNGGRTLYFRRQGNRILFSTVLPALLSVPGISRELDDAVIADFLANNHRDNRCSFFRGIQRVLGGETVLLEADSERFLDHWPLRQVEPLVLRDDREYVSAAREILDTAVRSCMRSVTEVPLMASGGLDSSCLVVSALGVSNSERLPAFTMVPGADTQTTPRNNRYVSERGLVEALQSAFPRLSVRFIEPGGYSDLSFAPERVFDEAAVPLRNVINLGWAEAAFASIRQLGAHAFIDGGGGNHTLTWDGVRGLSTFFRRGRWVHLLREASALGSGRPRTAAGYIWREALKPHLFRPLRNRDWRPNSSLNEHAARELGILGRMRASGHDPSYTFPATRESWMVSRMTVNRALLSELNSWVRGRYGLESRRPLLDLRLARFCMAIPEDQFLRSGQRRWLSRRLLQEAGAPAIVAESTKRGAWCPEWFTHLNNRKPVLPAEIARLRASSLATRLIDIDRLANATANWPTDAGEAESRRLELDTMLTRALHVGAFIQWAEAKS